MSIKTHNNRYVQGFFFYITERPNNIRSLLNAYQVANLRGRQDPTIEGQRAGQRVIKAGLRIDDAEVMRLQREAIRLRDYVDETFSRKQKVPHPPCDTCQFIAFCRDTAWTCPQFRGYVQFRTPQLNARIPDKTWDESFHEEDYI